MRERERDVVGRLGAEMWGEILITGGSVSDRRLSVAETHLSAPMRCADGRYIGAHRGPDDDKPEHVE